jgi:CRISPR system Cascade subunit CasA
MIENRFNLVDEKWISVADKGLVSLKEIFSDFSLKALGGNPIQKISITKLLLAIAQSAYTPKDDEDWNNLTSKELAEKSLQYLTKNKDCFWLYGKKPFLQMPAMIKAEKRPLGAVSIGIATGNTSILLQSQIEKKLSDAEKAQLVIELQNFAFSGKKTDNSIILTPNYEKNKTSKPGPSIGFQGFLHSFIMGSTILNTILLNLFTYEQIKEIKFAEKGLGKPAWENMPEGEDCIRAKELKKTYLGRLVPISRFLLIEEDNLHYSEGIVYPNYLSGSFDISTAINFSDKKPRCLWVNPEKRPWRQLTSLLAFFSNEKKDAFDCYQLRLGIPRAKYEKNIGVWSGGLSVSSNAGEQFCSGNDDFVESEFSLKTSCLGETMFLRLKAEMSIIEEISKNVFACVLKFLNHQMSDNKSQAGQASNLFWQLAENHFQKLIDACSDETSIEHIRKFFVNEAYKVYDTFCSKETSRQIDAWAKNRPKLGKYLKVGS